MKERKTVFITGASSGIGRATALLFYKKGWNVSATMRNPDKADLPAGDDRIMTPACDVTDVKSIDNAVDETLTSFSAIDVLVNNAGYSLMGPFEGYTSSQIRKQFETNVFGLMAVTKAVLPHFRTRKKGTIINVTSGAGRMTFPLYCVYNASKWAVEGYSESLAFELRPLNIRVKIIEPGIIKTDFYSRSQEKQAGVNINDYTAYSNRVEKKMDALTRLIGSGPEKVAKTIFRAASSKGYRLRYPAAGYAVTILFFRKLIPERLFIWTIRKFVT
ncbi:MAG: SDR family oxidoreductase [Spirochaetales bacterium]|nr:SDR family oxidoreductase [Spirochaetales bacterium]